MSSPGRVLVVEDDESLRGLLERGLLRRGFDVRVAASAVEAIAILRESELDALLTDLRLGAEDGLSLTQQALQVQPDLPVIVMTAFGNLDTAVGAIRAGAYDFLTKPIDVDAAQLTLDRAVLYRRLKAELVRVREIVSNNGPLDEMVGESASIRAVRELVRRVAPGDATVLVTGESGTGKEVVARTLHRASERSSGPFVAVNCAALPENLLESELFGHVRGAFTDARSSRPGLFAQASGGTLFLDEVGEIPLTMQPKLLRVLEERRVRPVGGDRELEVDVRIVAATNRDLRSLADEGKFREDLYFRLAVMEIDLPPLRARGHDVLLIAQRELMRRALRANRSVRGFSPEAGRLLLAYKWPGNVRELQNTIERALAMARFDHITPDDLPERLRSIKPAGTAAVIELGDELLTLSEIERRYIHHVLEAVQGHRKQAAKILGLDRKTLYRKLEQWKTAPEDDEREP
jgi:two-component system response regulator AtoC